MHTVKKREWCLFMCLHFRVIIESPCRSAGFKPAVLEEELVLSLWFCRQIQRLHLFKNPCSFSPGLRSPCCFYRLCKGCLWQFRKLHPNAYHLVWESYLNNSKLCIPNYCMRPSPPPPGTWPATQACALTGNWTSDPLVRRPALSPLSHTSQG